MTFDLMQFRDEIVKPSLIAIGLYGDNAVNLLLGTCAQESQFGRFLFQKGGPAVGCYQMEPKTYNYLWDTYIEPNVAMKAKIRLFLGYTIKPDPKRMASDLFLATILARLHYFAIKTAIPEKDNLQALAEYYKKYYNTYQGKATVEQFMENYHRYVDTF